MSGNVKFRWFLLASIVLSFLTSCASTGTLDNSSSTYDECILENMEGVSSNVAAAHIVKSCTLQINTSREVKLEGEERAKCEWERALQSPGFVGLEAGEKMECNDYSGEPRVQGYELCPPGWHDKFVAGVYSEGESRNKEEVRSGICVHNTDPAEYVKNMEAKGIKFDPINKAPTEARQCKAGRGCRRALRCEQCLWDLENVYWADSHGEGASWYPCDMC